MVRMYMVGAYMVSSHVSPYYIYHYNPVPTSSCSWPFILNSFKDTESTSEDFLFLEHQLDLFSKLCYVSPFLHDWRAIAQHLKNLQYFFPKF